MLSMSSATGMLSKEKSLDSTRKAHAEGLGKGMSREHALSICSAWSLLAARGLDVNRELRYGSAGRVAKVRERQR